MSTRYQTILWLVSALSAMVAIQIVEAMVGHMQPIGNQHPIIKDGIKELDFIPSGKYFYNNFLFPSKPVVMRGVLNRTKAMKQWTNVTYMKENFGSIRGVVDRRKKWEKGGREIVPRSVMNYSEFLDSYEKLDLYWDYEIPRNHDLLKDMPMPIALHCLTTRDMILYMNLMVNSGNVSYVIHRDHADNFFHFLGGSKRWLIANSKYSDDLYIGHDTQIKSLSGVSPDAVDLDMYPNVSNVPFYELELYPGDLLYVPRGWPHYVESRAGPSVAMNIWFGGNKTDYPEDIECRTQHIPLSKLWPE